MADDGTVTRRQRGGKAEALEGQTDWERVAALTDEEVDRAAKSDPDARPLTAGALLSSHTDEAGDAWDELEALAGSVEAPADWSKEHDHYLVGVPKRASGPQEGTM